MDMDGLTLLEKIRGRNPTLGKIKEWARKNWTGLQGEGPVINSLVNGWFSFRFRCREDVDLIGNSVWTYGKTPFQLKQWTPLFYAETEQLDTILVWVRLPGLPLEFWNPTYLSEIEDELGTFIEADLSFQQTKIKKVVRILVSLNIRTSLPEAFNFLWKNKQKRQLLDYEGLPFQCQKCHETRHLARNYPNFVPSTTRRRKWVR